jgi:hypothetical protein
MSALHEHSFILATSAETYGIGDHGSVSHGAADRRQSVRLPKIDGTTIIQAGGTSVYSVLTT